MCYISCTRRKARAKRDTSRSSSLVGFALSLRESSIAFLKAGVWATMVEIYDGGLMDEGRLLVDDSFVRVGGGRKMKRARRWDEGGG